MTVQWCVELQGEFIGTSVMVSCTLHDVVRLQWTEVEGHFPAGQSNLCLLSAADGKPELESIVRGLTAQYPQVVEEAEDRVRARTHTHTNMHARHSTHNALAGWRQARPHSFPSQQRAKR